MNVNFSWTLSRYLGRQFITTVLIIFGIFLCLIYMIDFVDLMRRTASQKDISFGLLTTMTLMKLLTVGNDTLPFAILFGAMAAFMRQTRNNELVVARASGVSVWQFLAPPITVAIALGCIIITVYNPIAAAMAQRYAQLEARYLTDEPSLLNVSANGLWLRQADENGQSVIHALKVAERGMLLEDVTVILYDNHQGFTGRIDAKEAELGDGHWKLSKAWVTLVNDQPRYHQTYRQPTELTLRQVQESFADPNTISFWDLPHFIDMAEAAGFSAKRYQLHFYGVLATPVLFCTMVLMGAVFSLRISRLGGLIQLVCGGVFAGFLLYFLNAFSSALGISGILPPFLAAWAPAMVALLLGLAVLFHLEDG